MADGQPFRGLKLDSHEPLKGLVERSPCPSCQASRKYFCYECHVTVGVDRSSIPSVRLPIKATIIKHPQEVAGKSTATHACILAPQDAHIFTYPNMPQFGDKRKIILLYPSEDAISLEELEKESMGCKDLFEEVVFIDSTWQQANAILRDERLNGLQKVRIDGAKTQFWRPQNKSETCLATIEAVYHFFKEYHSVILKRTYSGEYDNLLYFFVFQYYLIQEKRSKR